MSSSARNVTAEDLVGAWRLLTFTSVGPDGRRIQPYGAQPLGRLVYTATGQVSAQLCADDRGPFAVDSLESASSADSEAKVRAFDTFTSYAGWFEIEGDVVAHHVEICLVPSMVGQTLRRTAELRRGTGQPDEAGLGALHLSYVRETSRGRWTNELVWERT